METTSKFGFLKSTEQGIDLITGGPRNDANWDTIDSLLFRLSFAGINTQTENYTLALTDANALVRMDVGDANTVTVPLDASVPFPIGTSLAVRQVGTGVTTLAGESEAVTLNNPGSDLSLSKQYATCQLIKVDTDEWDIIGGTTGA